MGKHRLRNRIKSMVGSLLDPDKDEQLKGSNTETEDNYEKILDILKENDQEDKSKLVELINEFHNRYRSIYDRYDQITRKLKEKAQSKKEKQSSSSSSSDSDSEGVSNNQESKNGNMQEQIHTAAEVYELEQRLAVETEEKEALKLQLQETEQMSNQLKLQSDRLLEENSKLVDENREMRVVQTELIQEIEDMKKEKTGLMSENETFMKTIEELNVIVAQLKGEKQESDGLIERFTEEIKFKNSDLERLLEEKAKVEEMYEEVQNGRRSKEQIVEQLEDTIEDLKRELEIKREEIKLKNSDLERLRAEKAKVEETYEEVENGLRSKEHIVEQLEDAIEDLKSELEIKGDEISTLTETVRNLEVKIRLSTQKIRITEQLLNETEHDHATKEAKLHDQNKSLMERISTLSETIFNMKTLVREKVNETLTGVDSVTVKFEEDYGHVTTRVSEITNEIHAAQVHLKQMKEDMNRKLEQTVMRLNFSEGENERLVKSLEDVKMGSAKKDEKINKLENTIRVKEEWISGFCEDKREAIKQLCIWADYYRDRSDRLQRRLLQAAAVVGGGR